MAKEASMSRTTVYASLLSDIGRRRAQNQDSGGSFPDERLFVVADGMGGHRGGEVASQLAVDSIHSAVREELKDGATPGEALSIGASAANRKIMERAQKDPDLEGMGTTATTLYFELKPATPANPARAKAWIGHVGDSRCYLLRREGIWQLTRDHSLVQEKLRAGMITRDQLKTDRMKNVITRSVGFDLQFGIDLYEYDPQGGDLFLLCSDGLSGPLEDLDIYDIVKRFYYEPLSNAGKSELDEIPQQEALLKSTVEALIAHANDRGGEDNITALIARFPVAPAEAGGQEKPA
jgi:protein phosphatase